MTDERLATPELSEVDLRRRLEGLNRLLDATRTLAAEVDLQKVLQTIITDVCAALDCERASLYQYDPATEELYTSVVSELEIEEIRRPADMGISGYVARHGELANVARPEQDARWNAAVDQATGFKTRNILAAPLLAPHDGSLLGVLQLLNKRGGPFDKSDEALLVAFGQHAAVALDRARLVEEIKRRQATLASLDVARQVQRRFMPDRLPEIPGYESATWWFPNQAVGGDYCDVIPMPDGRTTFCIADVSGHGLGPSLIMASVRAALRALLQDYAAADRLLNRLSRTMAGDLTGGSFITMVLAILDPRAHELEFANAGHGPALLYRAASGTFETLEATGFPLGVMEDCEYHCGPHVRLEPGDMLALCTDGIVEAMNADDEQFGQERLEGLLKSMANQPVEKIVDQVGAQVSAHYLGDSPPDDLTVLVLRRNGS